MYSVYSLWLGPNFVLRVAADSNFYLRLMVDTAIRL